MSTTSNSPPPGHQSHVSWLGGLTGGRASGDRQDGNTVLVVTAYFLLASPFEALVWFLAHRELRYALWFFLLNCGTYVEAALMLLFLMVLVWLSPRTERSPGEKAALIFIGALLGLATSVAWPHAFHFAWKYAGLERYVYTVRDFEVAIESYKSFSVFMAVYLGIFSGDLSSRWSQERRRFIWLPPLTKLSASGFVWISLIAWLATYRLSMWLWLLLLRASSLDDLPLNFSEWNVLPLLATSMSCIPLSFGLFLLQPRSKLSSIVLSLVAGMLIPAGAFALLITTGWFAIITLLSSIKTFNAAGVVWAFFVGDLRWRSLQTAMTGSTSE